MVGERRGENLSVLLTASSPMTNNNPGLSMGSILGNVEMDIIVRVVKKSVVMDLRPGF